MGNNQPLCANLGVVRSDVCDSVCMHDKRGGTQLQEHLLTQSLLTAARSGDHVALQVCLAAGVDVDARPRLTTERCGAGASCQPAGCRGFTALMYAAQGGHARCVRRLLEANAAVNVTDGEGTTPLHLASSAGDLGVFRALVETGAHWRAVDEFGLGVLDYLPSDVREDFVELRAWYCACDPNLAHDLDARGAEHRRPLLLARAAAAAAHDRHSGCGPLKRPLFTAAWVADVATAGTEGVAHPSIFGRRCKEPPLPAASRCSASPPAADSDGDDDGFGWASRLALEEVFSVVV